MPKAALSQRGRGGLFFKLTGCCPDTRCHGLLVIAKEENIALRDAAVHQSFNSPCVPLEEVVGQHSGIHIGQVALAAAGELHIARRDPSLDGTRRHIVPNFLLGAAAVHFVVCDRDCNPITQSGSAGGTTRRGIHRHSVQVHICVVDCARHRAIVNIRGVHCVEQHGHVPVLGGQHPGAVVVHEASQGIELGLAHLNVVAGPVTLHRAGIAFLVYSVHQQGVGLIPGHVVVERAVGLDDQAITHRGAARHQGVCLNLRDKALKVPQHGDDFPAGAANVIRSGGGAHIGRSDLHSELVVVRGPAGRGGGAGIGPHRVGARGGKLHRAAEDMHIVGGQAVGGNLALLLIAGGGISAGSRAAADDLKADLCLAGIGDGHQIEVGVAGHNVPFRVRGAHILCRSDRDLAGGSGPRVVSKGDGGGAGIGPVDDGALHVIAIGDGVSHIGHGGIAAVPDPYFRYGIVTDVQDGLRTQKTALIQDDLPRGSANRSGCEHSGL